MADSDMEMSDFDKKLDLDIKRRDYRDQLLSVTIMYVNHLVTRDIERSRSTPTTPRALRPMDEISTEALNKAIRMMDEIDREVEQRYPDGPDAPIEPAPTSDPGTVPPRFW